MIYRTNKGDMLDAICHKHYQGRPKATEAVLSANPKLAKLGAVLPDGIEIVLPELPAVKKQSISLWD